MTPWWIYYLLALLLFVANSFSFLLNLAALPGNWLILVGSGLFAWLVKMDGHGISWTIVGVLLLMAILGELVEFFAATAGVAKHGASRRAMALSVVGSIVGSIMGVICGVPIPIIGSAVAAMLGGAIGAFAGAALGEDWKGREFDDSLQVGVAAFWGRILGTTGKVVLGAIMVVVATVDSLL